MKTFQLQKLVTSVGIILFIVKLIAWHATNSNAISSDAMESIANIIAAFMGLYSLYLCNKPRDTDHPYGYGKVEFVAASIEGMLIAIAGILILIEVFSSLIKGIYLDKLDWGIALFGSTAIINYAMGYIPHQKGKKENFLVLMSAGKHLQLDTYAISVIVLSLLLTHFIGWRWLGPLITIGSGSYIIVTGWKIACKALSGIMDERDEALFANVVEILQTYRHIEWIDIHNMRIQQFGVHLHIDVYITLSYYYPLRQAHQEMEKVIHLLVEKVDRSTELNFHLDYCKGSSCELCSINCPNRRKPFVETIVQNKENIGGVPKHRTNN